MPDPQQAAPTIDLSAGLVPKTPSAGGIDLSAGLVPKDPEAEMQARHARSVSDARARGLQTNLPDQEDFMDKVRTGIGKEATNTVSGLANLANKVLPASAQIPTEQHQIETTIPIEQQPAQLAAAKAVDTTHGVGETLGGLAENIAEFAAGDEVLKGLSKLAKVPEAVLALAEKYPKIAKILTAGSKVAEKVGAPAVVGGAQGAVKESATGGEGAVKGFEAGAIGGAAGGTLNEVVGPVAKKLGGSVGLWTTAEEDILRAAQPGKWDEKFLRDWDIAKDRISKEVGESGKFKDMGEAADRIGDLRRGIWEDEIKPAISRHADETFDNTNVANAVRKLSEDKTLTKRFPEDAKFLREFADKYTSGSPLFSGESTVGDVEKEIERYNAKLADEGYWKKTPKERAMMEKANPKIAAWRTASDEMRSSLYEHLANAGEPGMADLKQTYGAMGHVEDKIRGQVNVAGRQRPVSLKQIIGFASGQPLGVIAALADRIYNEPAAILNRAVAKSTEAGPVKKVIQKVAAAGAEAAKTAVPATSANIVRFIASDGSKHSVDAGEWEKVQQMDSGAKKQD